MAQSRKRTMTIGLVVAGLAIGGWAAAGAAGKLPANLAGLAGPFDLGGPLQPEVRYYVQATDYINFGFDGRRTGSVTYIVKMKVVPAALSGKGGDEYTVREFRLRTGSGETETIPSLAGWTYMFKREASGLDE